MQPLARILLAILLLVFAAGTIVQAAAVAHAKMDMPMAMSVSAGDYMPGCDDCSDDPGNAMACFTACMLPALGLEAPAMPFVPTTRAPVQSVASWALTGQSRPPDPYPPKPTVLN